MVAKQTYSFTYIFNLEYYIEKNKHQMLFSRNRLWNDARFELKINTVLLYRICLCGIDLILNSLQAIITMKNQISVRK